MFKNHFGETVIVVLSLVIHDWPITFVVSYFAAFVAEAAGTQVARKYCNRL